MCSFDGWNALFSDVKIVILEWYQSAISLCLSLFLSVLYLMYRYLKYRASFHFVLKLTAVGFYLDWIGWCCCCCCYSSCYCWFWWWWWCWRAGASNHPMFQCDRCWLQSNCGCWNVNGIEMGNVTCVRLVFTLVGNFLVPLEIWIALLAL